MQNRNQRILLCGLAIFAILACNLGTAAPPTGTPDVNVLTLAAQTLSAQTPTPEAGLSIEQALTLAVETLQAQATNTTAPVNPPNNQPKNTKTPKPTKTPIPPTQTSGPLHIKPPVLNLTLVIKLPTLGSPKLNYTANPNYGIANLAAGFSPDPYSVGMTTGGTVDVSYLGGSCSGFATSAPDLRVNYSGSSPLLRIYFIGSNGDPAMVVDDPYGNFYCVNDSFGTVNPTIDFNNPASGTYNIWIASYAANTSISGTLYITENSGNHP